MARRRYQVPNKNKQAMTLNITSMTDVFTILLVFLLQTYSSNEVNIEPITGLRLPTSSTQKNPVNGVKLSISPTELKFDQTVLAKVNNSEIESAAIDSKDSNFIKPLFDELQKFNKENETLAKTGKVLLQADQELPFSTIRKVMYTASMAGFPNLKIVTTVGK